MEAGKVMYDGQRARMLSTWGNSQADIIRITVSQRLATWRLLDRLHQRLFQTPLDPKDPAVDKVFEDPKTYFQVFAQWLASDRYQKHVSMRRPKTDRQFARGLYVDLLGRAPDFEELRNLRNALQAMAAPPPIRTVLAKVILDSGKAQLPDYTAGKEGEFVTSCFNRYLGREPGQDELESFASTLEEPACEPEHIVRALLGSPEYQSY